MCECARDSTKLDSIDKAKMTECCSRLFALLNGEVFFSVLDSERKSIYEAASPSNFLSNFHTNMDEIGKVMESSEVAIRQLNSRWRVEGLSSFHLTCHSSRIYVYLVDENFRVLVIHKFGDENAADSDPDFDRKLKDICSSVRDSISALSKEHV